MDAGEQGLGMGGGGVWEFVMKNIGKTRLFHREFFGEQYAGGGQNIWLNEFDGP